MPKEYGGAGLTPAHARVFNQEIAGYDAPTMLQVPNFTPCMAVILEFGTHEQKLRHIPPILKGDHVFDAVPLRAVRRLGRGRGPDDGDTRRRGMGPQRLQDLVVGGVEGRLRAVPGPNQLGRREAPGSDASSWSRSTQEGLELHRIEMLGGGREFCQEFFTDVRIPDADRIGEVDDGWTVGIRWLFHERSFAMSPYIIGMGGGGEAFGTPAEALIRLARQAGTSKTPGPGT